MKLRGKLALTLLAVIVPFTLGVGLLWSHLRTQALEEATAETARARWESGGDAWCERFVERRHGRGDRHRRPRHGRPRRGPRGRGEAIVPYDASLAPSVPDAPPLDARLREALEQGAEVASVRTGWRDRPSLAIAVRMADEGPCAVIVVRRPAPAGPWSTFGLPLLLSLAAVLIAVLAAGPLVGRIRRLTDAVRRSRDAPDRPIHMTGRDEIAELAREFESSRARDREQMRALRRRDEALTDYIANTTHDLMLPVTVLQGHLVALRGQLEAGRAPEGETLEAALEESHHVASIVRNLSAAAKLEAGEPHLEFHPVDLNALVERVVGRHAPVARHRGVELAHAVPAQGVRAQGDPTLLEQAVSNLVHNAVRYVGPGGHVALLLETVGPDRFRIRVADDGPGIPEDELARVTERRFRGGAARKRHPHGLGLGLHIVRDVADRHGFELVFERPPEGGLAVELRGPRLP